MKVEFELNVDKDGNPLIKFRHYDKSDAIEQKLLNFFIHKVKEKGMILINSGGYIDNNSKSWENYEIKINNK